MFMAYVYTHKFDGEFEAQLAVEAFGSAIDYSKLPGLWRLIYTNAPDVVRTASTTRVLLLHSALQTSLRAR